MRIERFIVHGRVQGVGFRYFAHSAARSLGLRGWVKNRPDGTVECLAGGSPENLEELYRCLQKGPALSKVDNVSRQEVDTHPGETFTVE